jgi:hypothetical protein
VRLKPFHYIAWTTETFGVVIGYVSSEQFLDQHDCFNEIEAVHCLGNHTAILINFSAVIAYKVSSMAFARNLLFLVAIWNRMVLNVLHCFQQLKRIIRVQLVA